MAAQRWTLDPAHTTVGFSVRHMMFAKVRGKFGKFSGTLTLDEANLPASGVEVEIEAASIDTGTADRDNHLRSPDFFDAQQFPKLTFKSTRVEPKGRDLRVTGTLTMHGVSREVTLEVEHTGAGKDPWGNQRQGYSARGSLDRKDYGLRWNQALEAGGVLVSDRIDLEIDVEAVPAK